MFGAGSKVGWRTLAAFTAGIGFGFLVALAVARHTDGPRALALKGAYLANGSDERPWGLGPVEQAAGRIWDERNAAGFQWGHQMGVIDPRQCPGDHGPFRAGCVEAAKDRWPGLQRP